uniref:non-specific serine/threonine protein kinase n=1 Tax=Hirondellea gigas TaxID=1518452 RepID=A0A2P2I8F8_9CRUS
MGPKLEDFEVLSVVGSGTSGTVRKVKRRSDGRVLVWKELHYANMGEAEKQGLVQEVNLLRELRHAHIVRFLQHIVDKRSATLYIIMEHCPGGDLQRLITRCKAANVFLEEAFVWKILKQLCSALRACHTGKRLVLHRDIKPANVFLDQDAHAKLGDFGLARTLSSNNSFATTFVGTPYYMSPEVVDGREYNEKSDMWSLGCLMYELCALQPPFQASSHKQLACKIRAAKYDRIPDQYSTELWEVIQLLLTHEDFLRPTALMILYHKALRSYTTPPSVDSLTHSPVRSSETRQSTANCNAEVAVHSPVEIADRIGTGVDERALHAGIHASGVSPTDDVHKIIAETVSAHCTEGITAHTGRALRKSGVSVTSGSYGSPDTHQQCSPLCEEAVAATEKTNNSNGISVVVDTPATGRYTDGGNRNKMIRNSSDCANNSSSVDNCNNSTHEPDFLARRDGAGTEGRLCSGSVRPLSRISENDDYQEGWSRDETAFLTPPIAGKLTCNFTEDSLNQDDCVEENPLTDSLCPRVLLAAHERAKAEAIAKENEGTRTMSREEINTFGVTDTKMDDIMGTVAKFKSSNCNVLKVCVNKSDGMDKKHLSDEEENDNCDLNESIVTVIFADDPEKQAEKHHNGDIIINECKKIVASSKCGRVIDGVDGVVDDKPVTVLTSSDLNSCMNTTENKIITTIASKFASAVTTTSTVCSTILKDKPVSNITPKETVTISSAKTNATQFRKPTLLETSMDAIRPEETGETLSSECDLLSVVSSCKNHCFSDCMSKAEWKRKLSALRDAEQSVRDRESALEERERDLLKRKKRVLAMEQDARQHLLRAQVFLKQTKAKNSNGRDILTPAFLSPATVNDYRYSELWSETTTVSGYPGDSSVIFTAVTPNLNNNEVNPFLQMRAAKIVADNNNLEDKAKTGSNGIDTATAQNSSSSDAQNTSSEHQGETYAPPKLRGYRPTYGSDPCMADSVREAAADHSSFQRVPSVPADSRKVVTRRGGAGGSSDYKRNTTLDQEIRHPEMKRRKK